MTSTALIAQPHLYMGDTTGRPLDAGKVYFGEPNKDPELYPIDVFYDEALTIAATQPIRTKGGFLNASGQLAEIYAAEINYSVKALDAYDRQVFYKGLMTRNGWTYDVDQKTARTFNTVAEMVADEKMAAGQFARTQNYATTGDSGGAVYTISSTPTDYAIPLANGLYAIFSDTFDIRKFGIVSSATLDQTANIERMTAYADDREYVIDFHNYEIMTPKMFTELRIGGGAAGQGIFVMGMGFKKVHDIQNLSIVHDKTVRLESRQNQIVFAPKDDATSEQWFKLTNVTFDPWVANYQPVTDNYYGQYDGMRLGFMCHPHWGGTLAAWTETPTNYSFEFNNVHFKSAAYSYNLSTSAIHAKNIIFNNLTGDYLGLYLNHMAQNIKGRVLTSVYRDDLHEAGRLLVGNAIHNEAETTGKTVNYKSVDLEGISSIKKSTGLPWSAYAFHALGNITQDDAKFNNIQGAIRFGSLKLLKNFSLSDANKKGVSVSFAKTVKVNEAKFNNWDGSSNSASFGSNVFLLSSTSIDNLTLTDCKLTGVLSSKFDASIANVVRLEVNNSEIKNAEGLISGHANLTIGDVVLNGGTINNPTSKVALGKFGSLTLNNTRIAEKSDAGVANQISQSIFSTSTTRAVVELNGVVSAAANAQYNGMFAGAVDAKLFNSVLKARPKVESPAAIVLEHNTYPAAPVVP